MLTRKDGTSRSTHENNVAAVMGQMATGGGFSNLEQSLSIIGIPPLSKPTFIDIERCLGQLFEQYLTELMLEAGREEKQIAINNKQDHHGIPCITVIVDAGWSKRSHQHSYNANSGVGVIFGAATNKLLYMGVRNKYCAVCSIAQRNKVDPPQHMCFKNWTGSSTSMEADIIATGFRISQEMHGVRYTQVIGDGDSSVLHNIRTTVPSYGRDVDKIECANHAVKGYRSKLEKLAKDFSAFRGRGGLTKSVILKITYGARCAIRKHSETNDVTQLRRDLRAGPKHYLGNHESCSSDWCSEIASGHPKNKNLNDLPPNLLFEVERAGDRLVNKAHQLISNKTTNLTECFMSVRAKMDGGKQINRIQSGSFEHRCMAAGLSITLGPTWCVDSWRQLFGTPSMVAETYANKRKRKHDSDKTRKSSESYKRARLEKKYHLTPAIPDEDYGPDATTPDITSQQQLHDICKEFLKSLCVTDTKAAELAAVTADQDVDPNSLWQRLRSVRLTASSFATVVKRRSKYEKLVESILYKPPRNTISALEWGRNHEETARTAYISAKTKGIAVPYQVLCTGIHISSEHPWLAASPDGLVKDPTETRDRQHGILEIKCPYSARTMTPETACEELNRFCCSLVAGQVTLKRKHTYYYQIQDQMAIANKP